VQEVRPKRLLVIVAAAALVLPTAAFGKGPTSATLTGPGTGGITFSSYQGPEPNLTHITQHAGFFATVFGGAAGQMLPGRPEGDLGPRYTMRYEIGPEHVVIQAVYPFATPGALTYTRPGQQVFDRERSRGGWFRGGPQLTETLVAAGLPAAPRASAPPSDGFSIPTIGASLLLLAAMSLVAATIVLIRRRPRKEPAT
jgi:hypothetical protein